MDPVGAGDAYLGGLVFALNAGLDVPTAGRVASLAAVYTVESYGTQGHAYTREQFAERYAKNYGENVAVTAALDFATVK